MGPHEGRAALQIVVPCHNEANRLIPDPFLRSLGSGLDVAFVFVDDGSSDGTPEILADIAVKGGEKVSVLSLKRKGGKGGAVRSGMLWAFERQPEYVGFWDADLSTPLTALPDFMDAFDARPELEIVMGSRVKLLGRDIRRNMARHYLGRVFATAASVTLGIAVYDTQCGAKIFRPTSAVRQAFSQPFRSQWIFDVELLARYLEICGKAAAETRIYELPLNSWVHRPGSKLTMWAAARAFWDLARIYRG
jgi:glycosyltransferase involved in cell wall biosynthesis